MAARLAHPFQLGEDGVGLGEARFQLQRPTARGKQVNETVGVVAGQGDGQGALVVGDGFGRGVQPQGGVGGGDQIGQGAVGGVALQQVVGQGGCRAVARRPLQHTGQPQMQGAALAHEDSVVRCLVGQGVVEGVLRVGGARHLAHQLHALQLQQVVVEAVGLLDQRGQGRAREGAADDRGDLQGAARVLVQPVDARCQQRLE